jgi:hypothetical protein
MTAEELFWSIAQDLDDEAPAVAEGTGLVVRLRRSRVEGPNAIALALGLALALALTSLTACSSDPTSEPATDSATPDQTQDQAGDQADAPVTDPHLDTTDAPEPGDPSTEPVPDAFLGDLPEVSDTADTADGPAPDADTGLGTPIDLGPPGPIVDCGTPTFALGSALRRTPYLQSPSTRSVRVAFTATAETEAWVDFAAMSDGRWRAVPARAELFDVARTGDIEDYWAYEATLRGLADGGAYCYRVRLGDEVVAEGLRFDSAWTDPERPIRILAFGDSGNGSPEQLAVRDAFMEREFDLFLHLGDMAYDSGTFPEFEAHVFAPYAELLHRTPTWPTMGNHEAKTRNGQPYLDVYYLPEMALRAADDERYYSFDYGQVHFTCVESNEVPLIAAALDQQDRVTDDMIDWLRADLAASDQPWKIVFFHHPPFTSSEREPNELVRQLIVPVLEAGGVDLVLVGHDHHYERTLPVRELAVAEAGDDAAITYIVAGNGGAGLRTASGDWFTATVEPTRHGFVAITIDGCTATIEAVDTSGGEIDRFTLDGCE